MWEIVTLKAIIQFLLLANTVGALVTVFRDKNRDIAAVWAWFLVLVMLPGIGFIIYAYLGRKLSKEDIFNLQEEERYGLAQYVVEHEVIREEQLRLFNQVRYPNNLQMNLSRMFLEMSHATVSADNDVKIISDGKEKFELLLEDMRQATDHIHVCYYIFKSDRIGQKIVEVLEERAAAGVKVKVLYDPIGGREQHKDFFKRLHELGGESRSAFGETIKIINFRLNYRNHRKMVIIDGDISYVGGFNVGDEYLGWDEKIGYWRDTHVRIVGSATRYVQARFFMDWNASKPKSHLSYHPNYFPEIEQSDEQQVNVQIVSSGPDSERQDIKKGYTKMISLAKESITIQTPYFIPDDSVMETLKIALYSGIKVRLMIPCKPDHPFVYRATLSYAGELVELGAEVYTYDNGFLHGKTVVVDEELLSIGTANFDVRSFKLNFEINAFIYDEEKSREQLAMFEEDIKHSSLLTRKRMAEYSWWELFKQQFSRLLSPIL